MRDLGPMARALATVRVLSTGRVRLMLGNGRIKDRPRADRARARHHCPFERGSGLTFLPEQEKQKKEEIAVPMTKNEAGANRRPCGAAFTPGLRPLTAARYARRRQRAQPRTHSQGPKNPKARMSDRKHIQHIRAEL